MSTPKFRRRPEERPSSESPERLFDDLPRTRDGIPSLWAHQADILRRYFTDHQSTSDIALELPTGAGKTLPALLIAEWRRSSLRHRVAYACPNHQLAHQVAAHAARQGIESVTLVGSHRSWNVADATKYDGARAIAVVTYSTIFNSKPAISQPQTLLFDDAHAAEQYVASAWSVTISRKDEQELYQDLLDVIKRELPDLLIQRLSATEPDVMTRRDVRLITPSGLGRQAARIDSVLAAAAGETHHRYSMIRDRIDRCLFYLSWDGMLIRPYVPPTSGHAAFADASQRLYVSATLGNGGELERAFGRAPIARLPVPPGWDRRGSGRRFFVFPELIREANSRAFARSLVAHVGKALVLAPSDRKLSESVENLAPPGMPVFLKDDIEKSLDTFGDAPTGVLALANRYDGTDLADDRCRVTVLDGAPTAEHLQERFLVASLRAGRVLEERLRTRVIQGAGRCTRGLTDYSVVVVLGTDLTRFFSRTEVRNALRPEIQAELTFGLQNSEVSSNEMKRYVDSFLSQDDAWQTDAEPELAELRREAETALPPGTDELAVAVEEEIKAWNLLWAGDFLGAARTAEGLGRHFTAEVLQPYRALWLYFASSWLQAAAVEAGVDSMAMAARALLRKAHAAARPGSWLRETAPLPPGDELLDPLDELAVAAVADGSFRTLSVKRWSETCIQLRDDLAALEAGPFERGLTTLGQILGARSFKPSDKGRADSVWLFGDALWLTFEAKSETKSDGRVSMGAVRQANTHLKSLASDEGLPIPPGSKSLIVSPKELADQDAVTVADSHVFVCEPGPIIELGSAAMEAMDHVRILARNLDMEATCRVVRQQFREARCLPPDVVERLFNQPLAN